MSEFKVVFDWTGEGAMYDFRWLFMDSLSDLFVKTYNQYAEATNQHLDDWNKEARDLGYEESDDSNSEYRRYLREKYELTLKEEMNKKYFKSIVEQDSHYEWYIDADCQLHMRLNGLDNLGYIDAAIHIEEA